MATIMMAGRAHCGEANHLMPLIANRPRKVLTNPQRGSNIQTQTKETATQEVMTGMK